MILLTRLNGVQFALNPDLIERADATPDTVVTLVDGTKYVVQESLKELMALMRDYRSTIVAGAQHITTSPEPEPLHTVLDSGSNVGARVVSIRRSES